MTYIGRRTLMKRRAFNITVNPDYPVIQINILDAEGCMNLRIREAMYYQMMNAVENMVRQKYKEAFTKEAEDLGLAKLVKNLADEGHSEDNEDH